MSWQNWLMSVPFTTTLAFVRTNLPPAATFPGVVTTRVAVDVAELEPSGTGCFDDTTSDAVDTATDGSSGICVLAVSARVPVDVAAAVPRGTKTGPPGTVSSSVAEDCPVDALSGTCVGALSARVPADWAAAVASGTWVGALSESVAVAWPAAAPSGMM